MAKTAEKDKIRLRVRSYDHRLIDSTCKQIVETAKRHEAQILGPIPLPTEFKKYTVNRSTFVHKNSREQFEMRMHKRLIDILTPNQALMESLGRLNLPSGVDIEIKMS